LNNIPAWFITLSYAAAKDEEAVFQWLEKSYDRHEVGNDLAQNGTCPRSL